MKKSTILILVIVFLGSVLVVGLFGMKSVPFEERIYIEQIIPTSIITSDGEELISQLKRDNNGYYVVIDKNKYEDGFYVWIGYIFEPNDATNKNLDISIIVPETDPPATINEHNEIVFHRRGMVRVQFRAKDQAAAAVMDFCIYFN